MFDLKPFHTFALPSYAKRIQDVYSENDIIRHLPILQDEKTFVLGGGSNSIFISDFEGTVVRIKSRGILLEEESDYFNLSVEGGENWHALVKWCLQRNILGLENLALIPGTVGAAPIQNIGAYGVELETFVRSVTYLDLIDGELKSLDQSDCQFGYRTSIFKTDLFNKTVITRVHFSFPKDWRPVSHYGELAELEQPTAKDIFSKVIDIRQAKLPDPAMLGNAGSFFKNPVIGLSLLESLQNRWPDMPHYPLEGARAKVPAAWLIDRLGLKGKKVGGISCHASQPLVLTNNGSGTGEQLLSLAREIKQKVHQEFSITLDNEVRLVGKSGLVSL